MRIPSRSAIERRKRQLCPTCGQVKPQYREDTVVMGDGYVPSLPWELPAAGSEPGMAFTSFAEDHPSLSADVWRLLFLVAAYRLEKAGGRHWAEQLIEDYAGLRLELGRGPERNEFLTQAYLWMMSRGRPARPRGQKRKSVISHRTLLHKYDFVRLALENRPVIPATQDGARQRWTRELVSRALLFPFHDRGYLRKPPDPSDELVNIVFAAPPAQAAYEVVASLHGLTAIYLQRIFSRLRGSEGPPHRRLASQ